MAQGINGYVEFDTNSSWAKIRVYYNQEYDMLANESTVTIESVRMWSDPDFGWATVNWWVDGIIQINGQNAITCNSNLGDHYINVQTRGTWDDGDNNKLINVGTNAPATARTVIKHSNDGTAVLTIKIISNRFSSCSFYSINYEKACFWIPANSQKSVTLATIPRASIISNASDIILGNACDITWLPMSDKFYYKLNFYIGNWTATTDAIFPNKTTDFTYTDYIIPIDVAAQIPNSDTGTMSVALYTYSDASCESLIGATSIKMFSVSLPERIKPSINSLLVKINNSSNNAIESWDIAIAGYTRVSVEAGASGIYGSTISSYTISGGYSFTTILSEASENVSFACIGDVITSPGIKTFTISCKDSRGRVSESVVSDEILFYAYSKPNVTKFTVSRSLDNQAKIIVNTAWDYSSLDGKNITQATLYYKKASESNWVNYGSVDRGDGIELNQLFDEYTSFNFRLMVEDTLLSSAYEDGFISTIQVLLDFKAGGKGIGIGKICESDSMEVSLDAKFFGAIYINGVTLEEYIRSVVDNA